MDARSIIAALMLAASATAFAQTPTDPRGGREMRSCAQEPDPAKCEARRKEMREHMGQAREMCKGKEGKDRAQCMAQQMCAKAPDPSKCQAQARERMEKRGAMPGDTPRAERGMRPCAQESDPAKCEARRKEMREHMTRAQDACKGKQGKDRGECMAREMCAKAADPVKCQAQAKERKERRGAMSDKQGDRGVAPKN